MKRALALLTFALAASASADEGMWMPQQIPQLASELKKRGLALDPARLSDLTGDPLGAVISLGGCTASFVSPEGLIVTNHHCAFGSIQHNATPQRDLITNGFLAKTKADELPAAPGTRVWVTTKIEDVTARVTEGLAPISADIGRARMIDRREKELVAECEKAGGVKCTVSSFFEGSQYLRTTQSEITDVRLVYAPALGIGEFGGEIDNFEWPRHTGDFAFYRAWVDGKPYRPKQWLRLARKGVSEGDFVIVAGYPGRTFRYKTADEVRHSRDFVYPTTIRYLSESIRLLEEAGKNNRDVQIRNASRIKSFANTLKNYTSVYQGFTKDRIVEARVAREAKLDKTALANISMINDEIVATRERDLLLDFLVRRASPMLQQALTIARLAHERPKSDAERLAGYQERDWKRLQQASDRAQRVIEPASDRALLRYFLLEATKLPKNQRIVAIDEAVGGKDVDAFLDQLYANTKIGVQSERTKMLSENRPQLAARNDAMIRFATALIPLFESNEARDLGHRGAMSRLRPMYFESLRGGSGPLYPDANSTLRVTFGTIEGYSPKDATHYAPRTTLRGLLAKESGKEPFASPKALLAAAADEKKTGPYRDPILRDVPVNFLSTCDTTGGNSGSPTLNANGELVGLLFDGNYESIDADFLFNPPVTRSIHVDAQYMLWVMDAVDGADALIAELGGTSKVD
ncbi:MAG TPA: S46 family peptidase [Thermoanaerobaculia bacterium]